MTALLQVQGVSKSFGGLRAVQDVSLTVTQGSLTALIGPNGAGKTTLFALMSGFLRPDQGSVSFAGQDITGQAPHLNAALGLTRTFQIVQPFAAQTVRENIAVGAHLHLPQRALALARAEEVALQVGLSPQLDKLASDLTVAGRKRLEMARALAARPKLLLLDEVLAGVAAARAAGIASIKLNSVLMRGVNDDELEAFIAFVQEHDLSLRFIEVMRTNDNTAFFERHHLAGAEISERLEAMGWNRLPREAGAGAGSWAWSCA